MPDEPAAAPRQALKYTGDGPLVSGALAADMTAEQVTVWLTQEQYDELLANKSHKVANQTEARAIEKAATEQQAAWRKAPASAPNAPASPTPAEPQSAPEPTPPTDPPSAAAPKESE